MIDWTLIIIALVGIVPAILGGGAAGVVYQQRRQSNGERPLTVREAKSMFDTHIVHCPIASEIKGELTKLNGRVDEILSMMAVRRE